ncbi:hypothetical protein QAD02_010548 [Eretmocerus hayati]|uniref:Uncharacterized protein n=1 Tax=Eretmocerus hayati TaxID=131215 RepID=A0ACC2NUJ2_9HYME|nr:hypothetical protein QAD02_010548 [Eretmocerus hayati]
MPSWHPRKRSEFSSATNNRRGIGILSNNYCSDSRNIIDSEEAQTASTSRVDGGMACSRSSGPDDDPAAAAASSSRIPELTGTDWVEELQRKVFEECAAQCETSSNSNSRLHGDDVDVNESRSSEIGSLRDVPVAVIVANIQRNFAQLPLFRQRAEFLDELKKSLLRVSRQKSVNWYEFKESSERWFINLVNILRQDGNNNVSRNRSDAARKNLQKDANFTAEEFSCSDAVDDELDSHSINLMDTTAASSYSFNNSSMGFGTTDSTLESSEETDQMIDEFSEIDLQVRIRRHNEETAGLRDELQKAEETIVSLERDIKLLQTSLEHVNEKYKRLQKENEDQKDLLSDAEQREQSCKSDLRKLEKANTALQKKVEELETEKTNIASLRTKIDKISKENSEYLRQLSELRVKYDEKIIECEYLQEEYNDLQAASNKMEKSFEKNLQFHKDKIQELQNTNAELQSKINRSDTSSRLSLTPPPYNYGNAQLHSTPYKSPRARQQDSLFSELKAMDFHYEFDGKINDLKRELSFYNEEISTIVDKIDEALQEIAASRNEICVPTVQLVETDSVQTLKQKMTVLLDVVKTFTSIKVPSSPKLKESCNREKPDVLPESKSSLCSSPIADRRPQIGSDNAESSDGLSSVTSSATTTIRIGSVNGSHPRNSQSAESKSLVNLAPSITTSNYEVEDSSLAREVDSGLQVQPKEVIVPIHEALNRIIELKVTDEEASATTGSNKAATVDGTKRSYLRSPKFKSIFTTKAPITKEEQQWQASLRNGTTSKLNSSKNSKGDGPLRVPTKPALAIASYCSTSRPTMKTLKSEFKEYSPKSSPSRLASTNETFSVKPEPIGLDPRGRRTVATVVKTAPTVDDGPPEPGYCLTPATTSTLSKPKPRRKESVYNRSFDMDELQKSEDPLSEKRRSVSSPDVPQELATPSSALMIDKRLLTAYRSGNTRTSDSSGELWTGKTRIGDGDRSIMIEDESPAPEMSYFSSKLHRPIVLAPTKLKLGFEESPAVVEQSSRIIAGSLNFGVGGAGSKQQNQQQFLDVDTLTETHSSSCSPEDAESSCEGDGSSSMQPSTDCESSVSQQQQWGQSTYVKDIIAESPSKDAVEESVSVDDASSANIASVTGATVKTTDAASANRVGCSSNSISSAGAVKLAVVPVVRAMSSGEDSSAESECDARRLQQQQQPQPSSQQQFPISSTTTEASQSPSLPQKRSSSLTEVSASESLQTTAEVSVTVNGVDATSPDQQVSTDSSAQLIIKEDEVPKAFPSWTDEKLQESGIASFPDMLSELSENLSEEELKKKYSAFSVGLSTDRMTLMKRLSQSRRQRDQAEKNFNNEVNKMHLDIKELAPLCQDSESLERVERVRLQLDMVSRCAHRISCSAESLGAVHQERRVSRAVLIADRYLQTLRAKCEKLASELAETKKILAENNIVLEDNLSEMGDDVPRVRYRAVPNNNRTMMARRRASIATISRPLMGSTQDISKDVPRQRNSVAGRAPTGLRRPSLSSYETPKLEIDKLDRTDSSSSTTELREIFEQAESRRQSREENNNSIRVSTSNLAEVTNEHTEEEEIWSNPREDFVPEIVYNDEVVAVGLTQRYGNPYVSWLMERYTSWKPMIWGIFLAFLLGFFVNRVVSLTRVRGPPIHWWSFEELLEQYIEVQNNHAVPRPI